MPRTAVRRKRVWAVSALLAVAALAAACGTDDNSASMAVDPGTSAAGCAGKDRLSASGSSAQKNAMDQFVAVYIAVCRDKGKRRNVAYTASGSGDGRTQFIAGHTDFAGSDSPIAGAQARQARARCGGSDAWNLPLVFGPIAVAYHLDGVNDLVLDGPTLARIFSGTVTRWNDPAIAAMNEGVRLPDTPIAVIYRSDSSGTTDNFQQYLATVSHGVWAKGAGSEFAGGVGNGSKGSAGVAQAVASGRGTITYLEGSFADRAGLQVARIDNGAGPVPPSPAAAGKAVASAQFVHPGSHDLALDLQSLYGTRRPGAYPLVLATYEIVCSKGYDRATAAAVKSFLTSAIGEGQQGIEKLGYIPLPHDVKAGLASAIAALTPVS